MGVVHRTSAEVKKGPLGRMVWQQEEKPRSGFEVYKKFLDRDDVDVMTCGSPPKSFRLIRKPSRARTSPCGDALRTTRRSTGGAARGGGTPCATSRAWWSSAGWQRTFLHSNAKGPMSAGDRAAPSAAPRPEQRPAAIKRCGCTKGVDGVLPPATSRTGGLRLDAKSRLGTHAANPRRRRVSRRRADGRRAWPPSRAEHASSQPLGSPPWRRVLSNRARGQRASSKP
jgi:hypothetical protein